jgi:hypothetical protein
MPTETINAVIKKANLHDVTAFELDELVARFNELHEFRVPRPGQRFEIPLSERTVRRLEEEANRTSESRQAGTARTV